MSDQQSKEHLTARLAAADGDAAQLRATIHNKDVVLECYRMEHEQLTARIATLEAACRMAYEELVFGGDWKTAREVITRALADVPAAAGGEEGT